MPIYKINIPALPDPGEVALAAQFEDVAGQCQSVSEQFLRILSRQPAGSLRATMRFSYDPEKKWQDRTSVELSLFAEERDERFVSNLLLSGPLSPLYINDRGNRPPSVEKTKSNSLPGEFAFVSEILRLEEGLVSDPEKRNPENLYGNDDIPPVYWTIFPFEGNEENTWMQIDQALSACTHPAMIEIIVAPVESLRERETHYEYITQLMKINQYGREPEPGDDVDLSGITEYDPFKDMRFKDQYADEVLREHEDFHETLREPQFEFAIRCWSGSEEELRVLTPVVAESCFQDGKYYVHFNQEKKQLKQLIKQSKSMTVNTETCNKEVWDTILSADRTTRLVEFRRLAHMASVSELVSCFRMPVPNSGSSPLTMLKQTEYKTASSDIETRSKAILVGDDVELNAGKVRDYDHTTESVFSDNTRFPIHTLPIDLLKKHIFICGVPGSGKTTAVFNFLVQLHMHGIPFLVLESAKTEYRILKRLKNSSDPVLKSLGESIRVYSPGNESVSPFRFNPMYIPDGISPDEHMNNLMSSFQASSPMPDDTALPALLGKALEETYDHYDPKNPPYLEDLVAQVEKVMESPDLAYNDEIKGILRTAIEVRLSPLVSKKRSIGKIFSRSASTLDIGEISRQPCIIEMDSLNTEQSNLLSLFILTSLREHIKATRQSGEPLRHVIILEEAHNIAGNIPDSAEPGDPRRKAAEYITRMLAELRALGEGMIISDQLPSAVASEVIKNTGTKLAHRLTSMDDREEIGYTMLLGSAEIEDFARLRVGESYFYTEEMYKPRRVRCINSSLMLGFVGENAQPPDNKAMLNLLAEEEWFKTHVKSTFLTEFDEYRLRLIRFKESRLDVLRKKMDELSAEDESDRNELDFQVDEALHLFHSQPFSLDSVLARSNTMDFSLNDSDRDNLGQLKLYYYLLYDGLLELKEKAKQ